MALPWGEARAEFQLVRAHVEAEIGRGVSKRRIFEALSKKGKITMSIQTFYKCAAKALNPKPNSPSGGAIAPPPQAEQERASPTNGPLLTSQPEGKSRFQMADDIPNYD
ncbi:hypothetical protein KGB56_26095 (plasmid) [Pseudovibrio brasiliensis]|uniref:Uncharacterized protein n=1 Tax=Pseudovibrio brasiliensis TaxID=1898042 RepID=A0ABX8AVJ5_9HYPH|nr:hypothetical protein KGB56_26095 [Pseudovibrio brasiliensis]